MYRNTATSGDFPDRATAVAPDCVPHVPLRAYYIPSGDLNECTMDVPATPPLHFRRAVEHGTGAGRDLGVGRNALARAASVSPHVRVRRNDGRVKLGVRPGFSRGRVTASSAARRLTEPAGCGSWTTRVLLVVAMVLASAAAAMAQANQSPVAETHTTLSLGELYGQVQRINPRIQAARALGRAAQARVPGASRPPDPQFQLGFMNYALPRLAPMPVLGMNQLQLMQMLPLGGKLALAGRVASATATATGYRADDVSWDMRTQTAMAFYDLYTTDRGLDVARETLRLLRDIAATAEAMYRVGDVGPRLPPGPGASTRMRDSLHVSVAGSNTW